MLETEARGVQQIHIDERRHVAALLRELGNEANDRAQFSAARLFRRAAELLDDETSDEISDEIRASSD